MNRYDGVQTVLTIVRLKGSDWELWANEGPRRPPGHCIYCKGQCEGLTAHCELRVFEESRPYRER